MEKVIEFKGVKLVVKPRLIENSCRGCINEDGYDVEGLCISGRCNQLSSIFVKAEEQQPEPATVEAANPKRHKHYDLIVAWANGAEIETETGCSGGWIACSTPIWDSNYQYRIKPEVKPDITAYTYIDNWVSKGDGQTLGISMSKEVKQRHNVKLTFCGETGKLKSSEVI